MGNSSASLSLPSLTTHIVTKSGSVFRLSYFDLVDHIILLRQVVVHPEMIEKGDKLNYFIKDYCHRMSNNQMMSKYRQSELPWEIDWIWHVHRLHPINYYNDCIKQIPNNIFIDKRIQKLTIDEYHKFDYSNSEKRINNQITFVPSFDLGKAVLSQRDFLDKFQQHELYTFDLRNMSPMKFREIVENYILFMKLARKNAIIVPTFDIDLMWHTHMRYPLNYFQFSKQLCGFLLNHDDSITPQVLNDAYKDTAERWKTAYQSEYGHNVDRNCFRNSMNSIHCTITHDSIVKKQSSHGSYTGCGGFWSSESEVGNSNSCGSSCGSSCGGD
ncbi:unnamed protein product [Rotaria magnacalcarata]|uniref:Uncharacterized protein n=2 Tax=Rotaria magnacalcarata TaxID=392030 RepID=A0A817A991_9BILA|nr:unnamed protein product [Rotaria magnacalcarata]CAF2250077.1 unnamed protein product [Rotaria magnacalcarata]CAF3944115.1 unnamed protein product [Rotaria magnacalcarata]CAF4123700.1 unnamed protein product [Rotaria magnacalcarata]